MTTEYDDAALEESIKAEMLTDEEVQETPEIVEDSKPEESATSTDATESDDKDGVQKRINKITADKYNEKRRADELQRKLDEYDAKPKEASEAPDLKDFDYDDAAFSAALIDHKVQQAIEARDDQRRTELQSQKAEVLQKSFNENVGKLGKADFDEVANAIPQLPQGVVEALMSDENGVDLIYHMGKHLDQADKIANMTTNQALLEIGRMSARMNNKPEIKTSAAPEPIETLSSGGSLSKDVGEMTMDEIYNS